MNEDYNYDEKIVEYVEYVCNNISFLNRLIKDEIIMDGYISGVLNLMPTYDDIENYLGELKTETIYTLLLNWDYITKSGFESCWLKIRDYMKDKLPIGLDNFKCVRKDDNGSYVGFNSEFMDKCFNDFKWNCISSEGFIKGKDITSYPKYIYDHIVNDIKKLINNDDYYCRNEGKSYCDKVFNEYKGDGSFIRKFYKDVEYRKNFHNDDGYSRMKNHIINGIVCETSAYPSEKPELLMEKIHNDIYWLLNQLYSMNYFDEFDYVVDKFDRFIPIKRIIRNGMLRCMSTSYLFQNRLTIKKYMSEIADEIENETISGVSPCYVLMNILEEERIFNERIKEALEKE